MRIRHLALELQNTGTDVNVVLNLNRRASTFLGQMNGCRVEKVELVRDLIQATPSRLLAHAVYFWTDRGLFCAYGEAYRGLRFHDLASVVLAEVAAEELDADKELGKHIDEIDGKEQQLVFVGAIFQRETYAGTSPLFPKKVSVEYPCGLVFLFGDTRIALLASSFEPSLEVLTKDAEFVELMERCTRVEAAW